MMHPDLQLALMTTTRLAKEHDRSVFRLLRVLQNAILKDDPESVRRLADNCEEWLRADTLDEESF